MRTINAHTFQNIQIICETFNVSNPSKTNTNRKQKKYKNFCTNGKQFVLPYFVLCFFCVYFFGCSFRLVPSSVSFTLTRVFFLLFSSALRIAHQRAAESFSLFMVFCFSCLALFFFLVDVFGYLIFYLFSNTYLTCERFLFAKSRDARFFVDGGMSVSLHFALTQMSRVIDNSQKPTLVMRECIKL